ncbi:MAG: sulfatase-like hydrolase/transferase, partial [Acidimicrobiia bacterium]
MTKPFEGKIELDIRDSTPDWGPYLPPKARDGAPNVLLLAWDDLGYATMDLYGGPVETPNMAKLAARGVVYSNFHTTALCSPTRASLLTGRNATTNGMATVAEFSSGFPGISTRIPFESGFVSEVLGEHGYNTYAIGKWHLTPGEECNLAAFKGRWPLGRGFERFYGWLGGETSGWYPDLVHDNHQIDPPGRPEDGYHVAEDLSDRAIEFVRDAKVIDPDKPFFLYLAPQAGHAPHHAPKDWIAKYKGRFDKGYEAIRAEILERQIKLGLLPEGTELSPINPHGEPDRTGPDGQPWPVLDTVRPWDSLSADEQRLFSRMAEVFAADISYHDHQVGRVLDYLEESGQLDNTLVIVISDNGASG